MLTKQVYKRSFFATVSHVGRVPLELLSSHLTRIMAFIRIERYYYKLKQTSNSYFPLQLISGALRAGNRAFFG
jgi:hypothetical protein